MTDDLKDALTDIARTPAEGYEAHVPAITADPFTAMVERLATNPDVDADKLEKLVDIQMRIMDRNAEAEFAGAMSAVQAELPTIVKDAENTHTRSRYARLDAIARVLRPIYTRHGFSLSFAEGVTSREGYVRIECVLRHRAGHSEPGHVDLPLDDKGASGKTNKTPVHATGSTFAYGQRYLTLLVFNVTTGDEDDDGQGASDYESPLTADERSQLKELSERLFGDKAIPVLQSLARLRFHKQDGDWHQIPSYRYADAERSLREKAAENNTTKRD